ncbi:Holliday junction branch migration DNA helicase RuvB [Candidatus Wolfebacteria bacterium]|nr:Holliday junction branch migration DNA helicase RuvB [Candidatus Wolfebacteria bacterium]
MSIAKGFTRDDRFIDAVLRPNCFEDYIGQEKIKQNLQIILRAARKRRESADHLLFFGPTGLGKTTLASLVAKEMGAEIKVVAGPTLKKTGDLAAILSAIEPGDVLFIDECHRLNRTIEEMLYPAMEERNLRLILGKGLGARVVSLSLPPFTLIAATTRVNLLSSPLRSRFGGAFHLDYYTPDEIGAIVNRSAGLLGIGIKDDAVSLVAQASRFTPRLANRLLKRSRDFAEVKGFGEITADTVQKTLDLLGIDSLGLESDDRRLLLAIIKKFNNHPVGLNTLAAALSEDRGTIEEVYEPYLIRLGFLERRPSGRVATEAARRHLKIN